MLKETVTYTDFNGNERTEEVWFNLSNTDLMGMFNSDDDIITKLQSAIRMQDYGKTLMFFKDFVINAYGEKSADGRKFVKSPALSEEFSQTALADAFFMSMVDNPEKMIDFIKGVIPSDLAKKAKIDTLTIENIAEADIVKAAVSDIKTTS